MFNQIRCDSFSFLRECPGIAEEQGEVLVVVDVRALLAVVVEEFFASDVAITVLVEGGKNALEHDFLWGDPSHCACGISDGWIIHAKVFNLENAVAVLVEVVEGAVDCILAELVQWGSEMIDKFIVGDLAVTIAVEHSSEFSNLSLV